MLRILHIQIYYIYINSSYLQQFGQTKQNTIQKETRKTDLRKKGKGTP